MSASAKRIRIPAEWEPHECCWMAWALHREWGAFASKIKDDLSKVIHTISEYEPVRVLAPSGKQSKEAQQEFSLCRNVTIVEATE